MQDPEIQEWQRRLRERGDEAARRRADRATVRREMAKRRSRGMQSRIAEKMIRADLDAAQASYRSASEDGARS